MHQTMRVERIGLNRDAVEGKSYADARAHLGHVAVAAVGIAEFATQILGARNAFLRQIGIQLKRQPAHGRQCGIGNDLAILCECRRESALPDVAPGSDHV